MADVSEDLARMERERKRVEKELDEIRDMENRIREMQLQYTEPKRKWEEQKRQHEGTLSRGRLLTDALVLYGGSKVNFDQDRVLDAFKDSERAVTKDAINTLFKWLDKIDSGNESLTHENLNTLRATLAVMSGLRKHKWVELAELQQQIRDALPVKDKGEDSSKRNQLLKHIDDFLVILERLRRLHWKEVEYLDDFGLQLQNGGFPEDEKLQDYMYTTLLDRVKTYSGRYGFHNRSIAALDQLRRNYVELRTNPETHAKVWDDMKIAASAYDDYKAFAYTEELKQGVAAGIWPAHTLPLFLY